MKRLATLLLLGCLFTSALYPQSETELIDADLDSLFEEPAEEADTKEPPGEEQRDEPEVLASLTDEPELRFSAVYSLAAGYSLGWGYLPWEEQQPDQEGFLQSALVDMDSTLGLDIRLSEELRVVQKFGFSFPDYEPQVNEFFADYNLYNQLFFRLGRQTITWGESRNFPHSNLTARVPDDFSEDPDSYAAKVSVPVGIGGIEFLAFSRKGFMDDPESPRLHEVGFGGVINWAVAGADMRLGGFSHRALAYDRAFFALKTTVFGSMELYADATAAFDNESEILFSGSAGFYDDWFNKGLTVNGEYFYCGESEELSLKGSDYPLIAGHNTALNLSYRFAPSVRFVGQYKQNFTEQSALVIPGLDFSGLPSVNLSLGVPLVLGSSEGAYYTGNPDPLNRPISIVLAARVRGSFKN